VKFLFLSFVAGLISACGFAPLGLWPLALAALAFLMWMVERAPSLRSALARGYWFGVGQFVLGLNWIATAFTFQAKMPTWLGWIAVLLLSLYLAVYPAAATGLAWRWGRARSIRLILVLAAAWIVTEWLRASIFTGFAWNPAGVLLLPTFLAGAATIIGTYGLSAIAILISGALLLLVKRHWRSAAAVAAGAISVALAGNVLNPSVNAPPGMSVRIVQPNIGQDTKYNEALVAENLRRLRRLTGPGGAEPRLVLWPEVAVVEPLLDDRAHPLAAQAAAAVREMVGQSIGPRDILLTGGIAFRSADGIRLTSATNSVFAMDRSGRIFGQYDKAHLVPYGEYLPMRPILSAIGISQLAPGAVDTDPGPGRRTLRIPGVGRVGMQICYEIIFSGQVVAPGVRPDFIFNPSNDAWFGRWGPPQHLAQARLRALEEGLPVLRSTPTGISAVVDAEGRLLHSLPWRTGGVIDATLPAPKPPTLFARGGNLLPFLFALLLIGLAIAVGRKRG
jgi:apolipoprotein N-acyltransferase